MWTTLRGCFGEEKNDWYCSVCGIENPTIGYYKDYELVGCDVCVEAKSCEDVPEYGIDEDNAVNYVCPECGHMNPEVGFYKGGAFIGCEACVLACPCEDVPEFGFDRGDEWNGWQNFEID